MTTVKSIHTLDARNHLLLEIARDYFNLSSKQMFREIQSMRHRVERVLRIKGIEYDKLRTALVPSQDRLEAAFVFDTNQIDSSWYGSEVMKRVIPLFNKESNHSVLSGDYLGNRENIEARFEALRDALQIRCDVDFKYPNQFFIVYINNLTKGMVQNFDNNLTGYHGYVGFADMTFTSKFKVYLSTMLVNSFIKHGKFILQGHEPDRDEREDLNMRGYPFEENGYVCRSIDDDLMGVLLSYKIERPVFPGFEVDTEFALNAVVDTPMNIQEFEVIVDEKKVGYLKEQKFNSIARAGMDGVDSETLAAAIKEKIQNSYIYNLCFNEEHDIVKFNIVLEISAKQAPAPTRLLAALEYKYEERLLRLITLY